VSNSLELIGSYTTETGGGGFDQIGRQLGFQAGGMVDPHVYNGVVQMYGSAFPLLRARPTPEDWVTWAETLWERHTASQQARLHLVERNRLFRKGVQWISSVGMGPWREPEKPRDSARVVRNVIAPALEQRQQMVSEQRPGFRTRPASQDPKDLRKAEAQQIALEYQHSQQNMEAMLQELYFWAGTDGVSFLELFWDANRGPWHEAMGLHPETGDPTPVDMFGDPSEEPHKFPLGDVMCRTRRIEQVRVSAEAKATKSPWYWVIREAIPAALAAHEYGAAAAAEMSLQRPESRVRLGTIPAQRLGFLLPEEDELYREQEIVDRIVVYADKSEFLPNGLTLIAVGRVLQYIGPLTYGVVPMVRFTDGSADPSFFCEPLMDKWIDSQMRINAVLSKWVENVRLNAGARLIAKENAIAGETLVGGTMSIISVKGMGGINDSVKPLEAFSLGEDALKLIESELKAFEDLSGWNDGTRGSFSTEQSGRAVLAVRESLERIFAPPINAFALAMTQWAKVTLSIMAWGYDLPRNVSVEGKTRIDLAYSLVAEDFDGVIDVFIDSESMMPMNRSLKLFLLKDMQQTGLASPQEVRRRMPFAWLRNLGSPDEDQEARAKRVSQAIKQTADPNALGMKWQDDEAIHQSVLERELILPDDTPPPVRAAAEARWNMLGQQAMMKMQAIMPPSMPPAGPQAHGPSPAPPQGQMQPAAPPGAGPGMPFAGTNPPMAAGQNPVPGTAGGAGPLQMGGRPDAQAAAAEFDHSSAY
jgi:hypothetical protein